MVIGNMDITYPKKHKATNIDKCNVTIKTGTVTDGDCTGATTAQVNGQTTITNPTKNAGATLTIPNVNPGSADLRDTTGTQCTVSVNTDEKKLTIEYTQDSKDKCIEITLDTGSITKATATENVPYGHIFTETFDE